MKEKADAFVQSEVQLRRHSEIQQEEATHTCADFTGHKSVLRELSARLMKHVSTGGLSTPLTCLGHTLLMR